MDSTRILICCILGLFMQNCKAQEAPKKAKAAIKYAVDSIGVPSLSAAVYKNGKLVFDYTYGVKDVDTKLRVERKDPYHIGSLTKSITATLIAYLVDAQKINWETRIIDVFPELDSLNSVYVEANLLELLSHSSGIVDVFTAEEWRAMPYDTTNAYQQRVDLMLGALKNEHNENRGKDWAYANANYTIAALMARKISGQSWEKAMSNLLRERLDIEFGIGWAIDQGQQIVPKGHVDFTGQYEVWGPYHPHKIPISIQPAGDIYMQIKDLAKYGAFHITGLEKGAAGLSQEQFKILHQPRLENYGLGWNVLPNGTSSLPDIIQHQHLGSGGTFHAVLALFPGKKVSIAVAHNGGGNLEAISFVLAELGKVFLKID